MGSRNLNKEPALVLRRVRYGETSRIVTLFGKNRGRFAGIAKAARSAKSAVGGALEPPSLVEAVVYDKPGRSVQTLGTVSVLNNYAALKAHLSRTASAAAVLEALNRCFLEDEPNPAAFDAACAALDALNDGCADPRVVLWRFQTRLFSAVGFGLDLSRCPICERPNPVPGLSNALYMQAGAVCCPDCRPPAGGAAALISGEAVRLLRAVAGDPANLAPLRPSPRARRELTVALAKYLRFHLPGVGNLPALMMLDDLEGMQ